MSPYEHKAASDVLQGVVDNHIHDTISLGDLKDALHQRGFGILMMIFALPICFPAVPPGMVAIPAIPLLFFAAQMMIGKDSPWLPRWIANRSLKRKTLAKVIQVASPYLKRVERLLRARLAFASSKQGEQLIGFFCFMCAISILNPVPGTNMIPAIGIALMSLGLLSKDGVTIVLGMLIGTLGILIGIAITLAVIDGAYTGLGSVFH